MGLLSHRHSVDSTTIVECATMATRTTRIVKRMQDPEQRGTSFSSKSAHKTTSAETAAWLLLERRGMRCVWWILCKWGAHRTGTALT